ncbi:MAG: protein-L-isoaspartate(D-aspartate) O-methyltransferase [Deltaproteobacteria bacterium]|nr:protein-L-isoaspartate(D-aspartate) O-methyltransferase [Deltaproteobacteria bacterium]
MIDHYKIARQRMVETQLIPRGIKDKRVLDAVRKVPRHLFVDEAFYGQAYGDSPLPIGEEQTISQPFMVAVMTEALELKGDERVLELGTGSGYQTAILAELCHKVFSIERISSLAGRARKVLDKLGYGNVVVRIGDGTLGWKEEAPFDAIIVTAGAPEIPQPLTEQLKIGGRLVIPAGGEFMQSLIRVRKTENGIEKEDLGGCRFVKLIGEHGWKVEKEGYEY